jgi:hypothetical protein
VWPRDKNWSVLGWTPFTAENNFLFEYNTHFPPHLKGTS